MAVVHPEERAASAGILSVSRNAGAAIAPLFTASILVNPGARAAVSSGWWVEDCLRLVDLRPFPKFATVRRKRN
jgi:hypothetical protein